MGSFYNPRQGGGGGGAVASVNGQTGVVVLDAADVGAQPLNQYALVSRNSNQAIAGSTETSVTFDAANVDTTSFWSAGQPTRLTAPSTGVYFVSGTIAFNNSLGGGVVLYLCKNGNANLYVSRSVTPVAIGGLNASGMVQLAAGDYVEMFVFNSASGFDLVYNAGLTPQFLSIQKLSA